MSAESAHRSRGLGSGSSRHAIADRDEARLDSSILTISSAGFGLGSSDESIVTARRVGIGAF